MISGMLESPPLSRCGVYCGACYIYRAERDCGDLIREVAEQQKVELDEVKCNGCFAPEEERWKSCKNCRLEHCLEKQGLAFCHECDHFWEYSCEQFDGLENFCAKRGENIRQNLIKIMADTQWWLREQDKKWRCGSCGEPYSWYEGTCHHCGKNLNRSDLRQ